MTESVVAKDPGPGVRGVIPQGLAAPGLMGEALSQGSEKPKGEGYLPRELRIKLFNEVIDLREEGLSYRRVIDEVQRKHGVRLSKSQVSYWSRGLHSPYNGRYIPSIDLLRPSKELAYVIGVILGDGYTTRDRHTVKSYNRVIIGLKVKDREFADEFAKCLAKVLGRQSIKPRLKYSDIRYAVEVRSETLYQLLKKPVDLDRLKKYIEHCDVCVAAFLRGFFDSEGSVDKRGYIRTYNTDLVLLTYIKDLLERLGIASTGPKLKHPQGEAFFDSRKGKIYTANKDCYCLHIRANSNLTSERWASPSRGNRNVSKNILEDAKPNPLPLLYLPIQFSIHIYSLTPGVGFEPTRPVKATGSPGLPTTRLWDPGLCF